MCLKQLGHRIQCLDDAEWLNAVQPGIARQMPSHMLGRSAKEWRVIPGMVARSGTSPLVTQHAFPMPR